MNKLPYILLIFLCSCSVTSRDLRVVEVIDGDTVILSNRKKLRYIGIDTPETRINQKGVWKETNSVLGKEATKLNKELVEGKKVRIEFDLQKIDRYGRLLGYVFADGVFVNKELLSEGLAVLYTYPPNVKYLQDFAQAQKAARDNQKGLWKESEIIPAEKAENFINDIKIVQGRVADCFYTKNACNLYLGRENNFKTVIFDKSFGYFGEDICSDYLGKKIEVKGRIRKHNLPEIIVNVPQEIEILN